MVSREETISYEETHESELEYLKRMKMTLLQHPVGSGLLRTSSQELPSKPSLARKKRKLVRGEPHEPILKGGHDRSILSGELQGQQASPQRLHCPLPLDCQTSMQLLQHQRLLPEWSKDRQVWPQIQPLLHHSQDQQPIRRQLQDEEPLRQQSVNQQPPQNQAAIVWCNVCKLNCVTHHNFKVHMQGKKHKAKWDVQSVQDGDKVKTDELSLQVNSHNQQPPQIQTPLVCCSLCKVNCKNPQNLKRHLQGRKHKVKWDKISLQAGDKAISDDQDLQFHCSNDQQPRQIQTNPAWCTLCKLNCMNPQNLKRHLQGKKHKAKWNEQPLQAYSLQNQPPTEIQSTRSNGVMSLNRVSRGVLDHSG